MTIQLTVVQIQVCYPVENANKLVFHRNPEPSLKFKEKRLDMVQSRLQSASISSQTPSVASVIEIIQSKESSQDSNHVAIQLTCLFTRERVLKHFHHIAIPIEIMIEGTVNKISESKFIISNALIKIRF